MQVRVSSQSYLFSNVMVLARCKHFKVLISFQIRPSLGFLLLFSLSLPYIVLHHISLKSQGCQIKGMSPKIYDIIKTRNLPKNENEHHGYRRMKNCHSGSYISIPRKKNVRSSPQGEKFAQDMEKKFGASYMDFQFPDQASKTADFGYISFPCDFKCTSAAQKNDTRIILSSMVTADSFRPKLIEYFLDYYIKIAVNPRNILLTVQVSFRTDAVQLSQLLQRLMSKGVYYDIFYGDWSSEALMYHQAHKLLHCSGRHDWIIVADSDEFHEYPGGNVELFLRKMDMKGINVVNGVFLDRVSTNGKLLELSSSISLFKRFPLGCRLHLNFDLGTPKKVMAFKGFLRINRGHHRLALCWFWERRGYLHLTPWQSCPPDKVDTIKPFKNRLNVHHFKWIDGQFEATKHKAEVWKGTRTGKSYSNVLKHLELCNGICVSSPDVKCKNSSSLLSLPMSKKRRYESLQYVHS